MYKPLTDQLPPLPPKKAGRCFFKITENEVGSEFCLGDYWNK